MENLMVDLDHYSQVLHGICVKISNKEPLSDDDYIDLANTRSILCNTMAMISSKFLHEFCRNRCDAEHRDTCIGYYDSGTPRCTYYQDVSGLHKEE